MHFQNGDGKLFVCFSTNEQDNDVNLHFGTWCNRTDDRGDAKERARERGEES